MFREVIDGFGDTSLSGDLQWSFDLQHTTAPILVVWVGVRVKDVKR